jgi:hypothetical protein
VPVSGKGQIKTVSTKKSSAEYIQLKPLLPNSAAYKNDHMHIMTVIKPRSMRRAGHAALKRRKNAYNISVGIPEGRDYLMNSGVERTILK